MHYNSRDVLSLITNTLRGIGPKESISSRQFAQENLKVAPQRRQSQQLLSTKILATKRLEAHEKAALKYFSARKIDKCWNELKQCEEILRGTNRDRHHADTHPDKLRDDSFAEHQLYVLYLYAEFTYKLGSMQDCREYIARAKAQPRSSPYMDHINVLDICLLLDSQQYEEVLDRIRQFEPTQLSGKLRRRLCFAASTAYMEMHLYADAERVLQTEEGRLLDDDWPSAQKQESERHKLIAKRVECLVAQKRNAEVINILREVITTARKPVGSEIAVAYVDTLLRQGYVLEGVIFSEAWLAQATRDRVEMTLRLFRLYYQLGDYDSAVEWLADVAEPQFLSYYKSQDYQALGEIKHFQGADKEAEKLLLKAIEITEDLNRKCRLYVTLLGYELSVAVRAVREEEFSQLIQGVTDSGVLSMYRDYIQSRIKTNRQ